MGTVSASDYLLQLSKRPRTHPRDAPRDGLNALLARMGHPERRIRCVHIAGSKGKGSTALMLDAMLRAGGRRTGVFTSPHIERWNERIRLAGEPVDDARLNMIMSELQPHVSALHAQALCGPDFFEVLLVAALCLFERAGVDEAIIEAGIGARHDATMVVQVAVTALVSVELEHTDVLGADLAAIAHDKAAAARPHVPLVIGMLPESARRVVAEAAAAVGAALIQPAMRFVAGAAAVVVDDDVALPLPAPSHAQASCAAVAFGCLRALAIVDDPFQAARDGMKSLVLPGRLEVLAQRPLVVADSAHTAASMAALVEALHAWGVMQRRLYLVLSCSGKRDMASLLAPLLECAHMVYITRADSGRSVDPASLANALRGRCPDSVRMRIIEPPEAALDEAYAQASADNIVCATGSAYMAGAARRWARKGADIVSARCEGGIIGTIRRLPS